MIARRLRRDEGQVTALLVGLVLCLLMWAGLVVDGGRLLAARREARDTAAGAARAAAQAVALDDLRTDGAQRLDPAAARELGATYLSRAGRSGTIVVAGDEVTVTVTVTTRMVILGLGGLGSRTVTGTATARTTRGINEAET